MMPALAALPLVSRLAMVGLTGAAGVLGAGWWFTNQRLERAIDERDDAVRKIGRLEGAFERQNAAIAQLAEVAVARQRQAEVLRKAAADAGRLAEHKITAILNSPRPTNPAKVCEAADGLILHFSAPPKPPLLRGQLEG